MRNDFGTRPYKSRFPYDKGGSAKKAAPKRAKAAPKKPAAKKEKQADSDSNVDESSANED